MADFPCLPLWTDAYLADTSHLTTEEHGAYLLLLIQAWRTASCALLDDDTLLARYAGLSPARWQAVKPIVMAFWSLDKRNARWVQKRLKNERKKAAEKRRKARDSAASRWKDTSSGDANGYANASPKQCSPEPTPTYEKPNGFSKRASAEKPRGWVDPKTPADAVNNIVRKIRAHDQQGIGSGNEGARDAVLQLPAGPR